MSELMTDSAFPASQMYATDEPLRMRIRTHELYTQPKMDFIAWLLDHVAWQRVEAGATVSPAVPAESVEPRTKLVLDVGCGTGAYVEPTLARLTAGTSLLAADLSLGMLRDVTGRNIAHSLSLINADAMQLPLPDSCCTVVLANHMLYHVPRIEQALSEIRRVLCQGGYLIAATNSCNSMETFVIEVETACEALGHPIKIPPFPARTRFTLENGGALIEPFFPHVERDVVNSELVFPEAGPAVAYIHSLRHAYVSQLPAGLNWEALITQVERQIDAKVAARGEYRVAKSTGAFVAVKGQCR